MTSTRKKSFKKIKIGSRGSPLAIQQVQEVISLLENAGISLVYEHLRYKTQGDLDKKTSLSTNPADDFFTDTLDQALLAGEIDLAIHSAKDIPHDSGTGLKILALSPCLDETDCLIAHTKLAQMPLGAKIGTSSQLRSETLKKFNSHIQSVDIRGTIEERINLFIQGKLDGIVVATCALKRLKLDHLITEIFPWESTPLQGQLAVVGREEDESLSTLCAKIDVRRKYGKVVLVGAGPGDPQLITMKAIKALEKADCVFYDYLIHPDILNYAGRAEKIYAGKRKGDHTMPQSELSRLLRTYAMQGKFVVRLKGGDPLIFGRGADEVSYLRSFHIPVEIIPGVSSATGIPASLGIPLTARGISSSVTFLSAHSDTEQISPMDSIPIPSSDTLVFLMGLTKLKNIVQSLYQANWEESTPIMLISKGTTSEQKIVTATLKTVIQEVKKKEVEPPALILVGKTIQFWNNSATFKTTSQRSLEMRKQKHQSQGLISNSKSKDPIKAPILYLGTHPEKYSRLGQIIHISMLEISATKFSSEEKKKIATQIPHYDMIIFTSRFGVKYLFKILDDQKFLYGNLESVDCVVIGQETAKALKKLRIRPSLVSEIATSQGLLAAIQNRYQLSGKRILFPRSVLPNPYLKDKLTQLGANVTELTVYENRKVPIPNNFLNLPILEINTVFFSSPSTVNNFLDTYGTIPSHWRILSKGPLTTRALQQAGYSSEVLKDNAIS